MRRCALRLFEGVAAHAGNVAGPSRVISAGARQHGAMSALSKPLSTSASSAYPRRVLRRTDGLGNVSRQDEDPTQSDIDDAAATTDDLKWGKYEHSAQQEAKHDLPKVAPVYDGSRSKLTFSKDVKKDEAETPWYLRRGEGIDLTNGAAETAEHALGIEEEVVEAPPQGPAEVLESYPDLPEQLVGLHRLLTEEGPSALIARADDVGEDGMPIDAATGRPPIHYIHARKHDDQAWTEWLAVVQVRSSAGGSVSRVAKDVGAYLRYVKPPTPLYGEPESIPTSAEDFLGPLEDATERMSMNDETVEENVESETDEKRPWRPIKIMSREAQDGMRMLHQNDPERWSRKELAKTFQLSVESVRRILKSNWQPSSSVVARQNRRAREREEQRRKEFIAGKEGESEDPSAMSWAAREAREIALISKSIRDAKLARNGAAEEQEDLDQASSSDTLDEEALLLQAEEHGKRSGHLQPVFYEGLVPTPSRGASGSQKGGGAGASSSKMPSRAKSGVLRGDGEWCLVDAGWVVVHVMSARARTMYDVESQYEQMSVPVERFY